MRYLYRQEILMSSFIGLLIVCTCLSSLAQKMVNLRYYDEQKMHFGFSLAYNTSRFKVIHSAEFVISDTVKTVESTSGPGFNIGIIGDLAIGKYFNLRFIPALSFAERNLVYDSMSVKRIKNIQSIYSEFPLLLKYKSERVGNFRMYVIGGIRYVYDWASNAEARSGFDIVKIARDDFSIDYGVGTDFYGGMVKISLEIRASYGLPNVLVRDKDVIYSKVLDKLFLRTFLISLHFE